MPPSHPEIDETQTIRLILPRDANHYGTLYAGTLLELALAAAYATAHQAAGSSANLVLKRVLDLRCHQPVPVGSVVEIRGRELRRSSAQITVGLMGSPLPGSTVPWMDAIMQFVHVDAQGRPDHLPDPGPDQDEPEVFDTEWLSLSSRAQSLARVRSESL